MKNNSTGTINLNPSHSINSDNKQVSELMQNFVTSDVLKNIQISLMSKDNDENYVWLRFSSLNYNMFINDKITKDLIIKIDTDQDLIGHFETENYGDVVIYYDVLDGDTYFEIVAERCSEKMSQRPDNRYDSFPEYVQSRYNHFLDQAKSDNFAS